MTQLSEAPIVLAEEVHTLEERDKDTKTCLEMEEFCTQVMSTVAHY